MAKFQYGIDYLFDGGTAEIIRNHKVTRKTMKSSHWFISATQSFLRLWAYGLYGLYGLWRIISNNPPIAPIYYTKNCYFFQFAWDEWFGSAFFHANGKLSWANFNLIRYSFALCMIYSLLANRNRYSLALYFHRFSFAIRFITQIPEEKNNKEQSKHRPMLLICHLMM